MRNSLPTHQAGTALAVLRVSIGLLGLLSPRRAQQAALLPTTADASTPIWTRFWATRALALGVGYLAADAPTRRHLIRMGLVVDATDTGFLVLTAAARPRLPLRALLWLAAITSLSTAADIIEIRRERDDRPWDTAANTVSSVGTRVPVWLR